MKIILLAFANDPKDPLPNLQEEDQTIYEVLARRQLEQHYIIIRESFATIKRLTAFISMHREHLILLHYGGHAGRDALRLDGENAQAEGLADLLGNCPNLSAVVLNGCSTAGQVQLLRDRGVPSVIATSAPIEDRIACDFGIRLYQELVNRSNLVTAFDAAWGLVRTQRSDIEVRRGFGEEREAELEVLSTDAPLWAFYSSPSDETWQLPSVAIRNEHADFTPNRLLIDVLHETFRNEQLYQDALAHFTRKRHEVTAKVKENAVLDVLPNPLSIQFRKLFASDQVKNFYIEAENSYNKLGKDRLYQLTAIYRLLLELLLAILLGQTWEELRRSRVDRDTEDQRPFAVSSRVAGLIRRCFLAEDTAARDAFDLIPLIMAIRHNFDRYNREYFIPELKDLSDALTTERKLGEATLFFQSISRRIAYHELDNSDSEAEALCILAEEHLAEIALHLAFICRYNFASIKAIDLLKFRHRDAVRYQHAAVELIQGMGSEKKALEHIDPTDTISVVLMRWKGHKRWDHLNLSPFIIDENAHNKDATKAKLRYLLRYDRHADAYAYRHIDKLIAANQPLLIKAQEKYSIIREQIEAFLALIDENE